MKNRIITGTVQILSGQAASVALTLLRNIILARLLGLEQFGIGLTFAITISFLEMAASFSFDKFIIQDKQGEDPVLLGTTHGFVLARGILIALALVLAGDLIAFAFGLPDLAWAYQVLALAPLCGGLCHADVARFQRRLRYAPLVATQLVSEVCGLLVGIALAWWLGDYRSMLYAIVARYIAFAVLSHFVAEGPYRITFESEIARRIWRFGWPLMVNGLILFAASQGDRALVARAFGVEALGIYGVAALATQMPGFLVLRAVNHIALPILSHQRDDKAALYEKYRAVETVVVVCAIVISIPLFAALTPLISLVFGSEFDVPDVLVSWLILGLAVRIFRAAPVVVLLALADTKELMLVNVLRTIGFMLAIFAVLFGGDMVDVAIAQFVGEVVATAFVIARLGSRHGLPLPWPPTTGAVATAAIVVSFCLSMYFLPRDLPIQVLGHGVVLASALLLLFVLSTDFRRLVHSALSRGT